MFGSAPAQVFSEGQVWSYKTRKGEENSTVLINKVESHPKLGKIFHISISGVKIENQRTAGGVSTELSHSPVSEDVLKKSLTKLLRNSSPNSDYVEGYKTWKEAFDRGDAGVFTVEVADIVGFIEKAINQP
jgi:hypothetical protein